MLDATKAMNDWNNVFVWNLKNVSEISKVPLLLTNQHSTPKVLRINWSN